MERKFRKLGLLFVLCGSMFLYSCGGGDEKAEQTEETETTEDLDDVDELTDDTEAIDEDAAGWEVYTNEAGNFSVEMPGTPQESSQVQDTDVGPIEIHMFMHQPSDKEIFVIGYNDMPAELMDAVDEATKKQMLEGGLQGGLGALRPYGTQDPVVDKKEHYKFYDQFPALKAKAHNGTYYVFIKCFIKENRLYQVWHMKEGNYSDEDITDKFVSSFKLLDQE